MFRMPGIALSLDEREEIRAGIERGESCAVIASLLGRDPSTVTRELRRNGGRHSYRAISAQRRAVKCRRRPKIPKLVANPALARVVNKDLRAGFSPAAVSARLRRGGGATVCAETLYQALYSRTFRGLTMLAHHCLRSRRRRRRPRGYRTRLTQRPHALGSIKTIHQRPPSAIERVELGHWEGDLITGPANQSAVITLVERVTRFTILGYLPTNHHADVVRAVLTHIFADVPPELRRTLTWDRGNEMAAWPRLETDSGLAVYFCDPHSPWQRPTNEHTNRQLRYWLPKGQDLRHYSEHDLRRITDFLNNQPRRLLNWDTPAQRYDAAAMH
jgi:IS30 family transposase